MSYRPNLLCTVGSLALSLVPSAGNATELIDPKKIMEAISKATAGSKVKKCDPYLDVGCTLPRPETPFGCSDCNPVDWSRAFVQDKEFVLPDSIELDGKQLKLLTDPSKQEFSIFTMPAETGF